MSSQVVIKILGDAKGYLGAVGQSTDATAGLGQRAGAAGRTLTTRLSVPLFAAAGGALALANRAGEAADELLDMEAQTGISTDTLQEFRHVAGQAGVDQDFFAKAAEEVIKSADQLAKGVGPAAEAFAQLGIETHDAAGEIKSAEALTTEAMEALAAIEDPTRRAALAQDIFRRANQDMLPVLSQGLDVIRDQRDAARDLGAVQSREALEGANAFRMGMEELKTSLGGIVATLGSELGPILNDVVVPIIQDSVVPALRTFAGFIGGLMDSFNSLSPPLKNLISGIVGIAAVIGPLLIVGSKMIAMWGAVKAAFIAVKIAMLSNPFTAIALGIAALVVLVVANWDTIKRVIGTALETIKSKVGAVWGWIEGKFKGALRIIAGVLQFWPGVGFILNHFNSIRDAATRVVGWIKDRFDDAIEFFKGLPGRIASAVSGMWSGITSSFRDAVNFLIDAWNKLDIEIGPFSIPTWVPVFGGRSWHEPDLIPDIPRFHSGGVFRARGGGEGLAVLEDGETVIPRSGGAGSVVVNVSGFVGSESALAAELDRLLTRRGRHSSLGFV